MAPAPDDHRFRSFQPVVRGCGCGCALPGPALILLAAIVILVAILSTRDNLRSSALWLVLLPLVGGFLLLYVRVQRYRNK